MKKVTENFAVELVTLRQVAGLIGSSPEVVLALADRAGAKIVERWDGDLCIDGAVARKIREDQEAEQIREIQLQGEHRSWVTDRAARRQQVIHEAYQGALKKAFAEQQEIIRKINTGEIESEWVVFPNSGVADPQAQSVARAAGTQAGRAFDAKEPELGFYEWKESR